LNLQPTLENDLLLLRPLEATDFDALYEVAKDPLLWEQHQCSDRYEKEVYTKFFEDSTNSESALVVIEKSGDKIIGSSRFNKIVGEEKAIEIGWSFLSRDKWGGKYNKQVKQLMIDYAFDYVDHIIFYIDKDNLRSQKAVIKIGGKDITKSSMRNLVKDNSTDLTFRIGREEWQSLTI